MLSNNDTSLRGVTKQIPYLGGTANNNIHPSISTAQRTCGNQLCSFLEKSGDGHYTCEAPIFSGRPHSPDSKICEY